MACIFLDGFDKYGITTQTSPAAANTLTQFGEWGSSNQPTAIVGGLSSTGYAIQISVSSTTPQVFRGLGGSTYGRLIGGLRFKVSTIAQQHPMFVQFNGSNTNMCCITNNITTGTFSLRTGGTNGTALATSSAAIIANVIHYIEWDITFGASSAWALYLDSILIASGTGNTGNGKTAADLIALGANDTAGSATFDDMYLFDSTGTRNKTVLLTNPRIETRSPTGDTQTQWTNAGNVIVPTGITQTSPSNVTASVNGPGANELVLLKIIPSATCNLQSVGALPQTTSTTAKFKAVLYSNAAPAATPTLAAGNLTLTNGNLTFTAPSGSWLSNLSNGSAVSGKGYFECTTGANVTVPSGSNANLAVAVADGAANLGSWLGQDTHAVGYFNDNRILTGGSSGGTWQGAGPNKVIGIAVDFANRKIWVANITDAPTNWNGSTSNNPATGVGGISFNAGMTGPTYVGVSAITVGGVASGTLNFGATSYTGSVPSGFGNVIWTEPTIGTLTATGTEVVGVTANTSLALPFGSGQSLTGGTSYWIGYITDTNINISEYDTTTNLGQKKANTYGSGAPAGPLSSMTTGQVTWEIWGNATGATTNYSSVASNPVSGAGAANDNSTINATIAAKEDLYTWPALTTLATTVYAIGVKANIKNTDVGVKTVDLRLKSNATDSAGSKTGQSVGSTYVFYSSYFDSDPNGDIAWTANAANAASAGPKVVS